MVPSDSLTMPVLGQWKPSGPDPLPSPCDSSTAATGLGLSFQGLPSPTKVSAGRLQTKAQNSHVKSCMAFPPHPIALFTQTSLNLQSLCHSYTSGDPQCSKNLNTTSHTNPSKPSTKNIDIKLFTRRS